MQLLNQQRSNQHSRLRNEVRSYNSNPIDHGTAAIQWGEELWGCVVKWRSVESAIVVKTVSPPPQRRRALRRLSYLTLDTGSTIILMAAVLCTRAYFSEHSLCFSAVKISFRQ